jgi:hypothetical protein
MKERGGELSVLSVAGHPCVLSHDDELSKSVEEKKGMKEIETDEWSAREETTDFARRIQVFGHSIEYNKKAKERGRKKEKEVEWCSAYLGHGSVSLIKRENVDVKMIGR